MKMYYDYRDYATIPPTYDDIELSDKKKHLKAALISSTRQEGQERHNDDEDNNQELLLSDPVMMRRGRGNRGVPPALDDATQVSLSATTRFIGIMGTNFPARLHDLLTMATTEEDQQDPEVLGGDDGSIISSVISWLPHGRSWIIHDKATFTKTVSKSHFHFSKYESFIRQVNAWGFKRVTRGRDVNSYYHELFLRGMPHLVQFMKRNRSRSIKRKRYSKAANGSPIEDPPDFYAMERNNPIPDYFSRDNNSLSSSLARVPASSEDDHTENQDEEAPGEEAMTKENPKIEHTSSADSIPNVTSSPTAPDTTPSISSNNNKNYYNATCLFSSAHSCPDLHHHGLILSAERGVHPPWCDEQDEDSDADDIEMKRCKEDAGAGVNSRKKQTDCDKVSVFLCEDDIISNEMDIGYYLESAAASVANAPRMFDAQNDRIKHKLEDPRSSFYKSGSAGSGFQHKDQEDEDDVVLMTFLETLFE